MPLTSSAASCPSQLRRCCLHDESGTPRGPHLGVPPSHSRSLCLLFPHHSPIHFGCHVRMGVSLPGLEASSEQAHTYTSLRPHDMVPLSQGECLLASAWPWCPSLCLSQACSRALSKPCQSWRYGVGPPQAALIKEPLTAAPADFSLGSGSCSRGPHQHSGEMPAGWRGRAWWSGSASFQPLPLPARPLGRCT